MKRMKPFYIVFAILVIACQGKPIDQLKEQRMAKNFENFIENAWNKKNMDSLKSVSVVNYNRQLNGINVAENLNELEANMNIYFNGFPDVKISVIHKTIKNNQLFAQWTFEGTNTGIFGETPPTGKHVVISGYSELTFDEHNNISQEKVFYNELQLLQQLGYTLIPPNVE
jgi:predicted ester cyclase